MINGYVGTPGTGKSYEAIRKILQDLQKKDPIFSNTPTKLIDQQPPKNPIKNQE